jgi:hypothetical protein
MPLNEIPTYLSPETRSLVDSTLEQALLALKNDVPAVATRERQKLAGTIVALVSVGEIEPTKLVRFALHAARGARRPCKHP